MRRVAVLLMALFLVNLPFVNQTLANRDVAQNGQEVTADLLAARKVGDRGFVDFRLPRAVDPQGRRFSARVDDATYAAATQSRTLVVRVVPGKPAHHQVVGEVDSPLFAIIALVCDVVLALGLVVYWRRRRWRLHEILEVGQEHVVLRREDRTLTATAPERWLLRVRAGQRVAGSLHLVADADVLPRDGQPGLEQVDRAAYVVRGRVLDAREGHVHLDTGNGESLVVETGPHRIRADLRDLAETTGTLCFTPN